MQLWMTLKKTLMDSDKIIERLMDIIQQQATIIASFYRTIDPLIESGEPPSNDLEDALALQDSSLSGGEL